MTGQSRKVHRWSGRSLMGYQSAMATAALPPPRRILRSILRVVVLILFTLLVDIAATPLATSAAVSVGISVNFAPPPLPVYVQPVAPGPGYLWIPGYWAWDPDYGYYWVPGTWVLAPYPGWLWTPGYWGWDDGVYVWYEGYWGPVVGFYGGINYGCGYNGYGYYGGYWRGNTFYYNRAVNNLGNNINTVYRRPVTRTSTTSRVSFNGGRNGVHLRPTQAQRQAANRWASQPVAAQKEHMQAARRDPALRVATNHGRPPVAATAKPGAFRGPGVVGAKRAGGPYHGPAQGPSGHGERAVPPGERPQPQHRPTGGEVAPHAMPPRGGYEQPSHRQPEPRYEHPAPGEHRAPREYAPAPAPHSAPPAGREYAPPAVRSPGGMPHAAPPSGGHRMEPPSGGFQPGEGGGRPEGGGGRPEGGPHGR